MIKLIIIAVTLFIITLLLILGSHKPVSKSRVIDSPIPNQSQYV